MILIFLFSSLVTSVGPVQITTSLPQTTSNNCKTSAIIVGDYAGQATYCPDWAPLCRNKGVINVAEDTNCITDCRTHTGGTWCMVDASQWSYCKNQAAHTCPETCAHGFDRGEVCSEGYRRNPAMDSETCSSLDPAAGACEFSTNDEHMQKCCMLNPTQAPTTDMPSYSPSRAPSSASPTVMPTKIPSQIPSTTPSRAPSPEPSSSLPTKSPETSAPSVTPTVDCSVFVDEECPVDQGCVLSVMDGTCGHRCPMWVDMMPGDDWIAGAHELINTAEMSDGECDAECRNDPTCSVYVYNYADTSCITYDTHISEDLQNLVQQEEMAFLDGIITGRCHTTLPPSDVPTVAPTTSPSKSPSTSGPSTGPSFAPVTSAPSTYPSRNPSIHPSYIPSVPPTTIPSNPPSPQPSRSPTTSHPTHNLTTLSSCPFNSLDQDYCDVYCVDFCHTVTSCKDFVLVPAGSGPTLKRIRPNRFAKDFDTGIKSAPKEFVSPAVGFVDEGICNCLSMIHSTIPGMQSSHCLMSAAVSISDSSDKSQVIWWVIGAMMFCCCCLLPLLLYFCYWSKDEPDVEHILLDDEGVTPRNYQPSEGGRSLPSERNWSEYE